MPRIGNPVRALVRLDDRVLGRWLDRPRKPLPFRTVLIGYVVIFAVMVLLAVLTREIVFILGPIVPLTFGLYQARRQSRP